MGLITSENVSVLETAAATTQSAATSRETPAHISLPDKPLVTIEPSKSWVALNLRGLWESRELFYFLMWRDVKVRYKQTVLGAAWAIIQPLFTTIIFTIFFGILAGIRSGDIPYALFALSGLVPWMFFSGAVTSSSNSLLGDSRLITKVYFPRMLIPCATVGAALVDFAIAFVTLLGLMIYYRITPTWNLLLLPVLVLMLTLLALGIGMWMSALIVKYRDIRYALPFTIQLWMFASPIIYPSSIVPEKWRWLYSLNPLTGIIEGFRAALFGQPFNMPSLAISSGVALALLIFSAYMFRRMEKDFADVI
jgi:lipopolysaccharide transport system permease protein